MKRGFEAFGKHNQNPIGSEGRSAERRKSGRDMGLTPSEKRRKSQLMRQFLQRDGSQGSNEAYCSSPVWCDCGKRMRPAPGVSCERCAAPRTLIDCAWCAARFDHLGELGPHLATCNARQEWWNRPLIDLATNHKVPPE